MSEHREMLQAACNRARRKGYGNSTRGNRKIVVYGEYSQIMTFVNVEHRIRGTVTCYYYGSKIFEIDFINKRVTNFKMENYSVSTSIDISAWVRCIRGRHDPENKWCRTYSLWTATEKTYGIKADNDTINTMYERFRKKVPWVYVNRDGIPWFAWDKYDANLADAFFASRTHLYNNQNWRYFEYDWNEQGDWACRFKNADAERRWNKREKRHLAIRKAA